MPLRVARLKTCETCGAAVDPLDGGGKHADWHNKEALRRLEEPYHYASHHPGGQPQQAAAGSGAQEQPQQAKAGSGAQKPPVGGYGYKEPDLQDLIAHGRALTKTALAKLRALQ